VLTTDYGWNVHGYNAAGQEHLYDEAGFESTDTGYFLYENNINQTYDGDGEAGKRVETRYTETEAGPQNNSVTTIRYLRSTVLGGAIVVGVDDGGAKYEGNAYAGGHKIADTWGGGLRNVNPVTGAWVSTIYGWGVIGGTRTELNPLGADVGAFSFRDLGAPLAANVIGEGFIRPNTRGRDVFINSQGRFMAVNGAVPTQLSLLSNGRPGETAFVTTAIVPGSYVRFQNDVKFASFILLHELGHRRGIYGKDNKDAIDDKNGTSLEKTARNNQKILDACFPP